jgi:hypothetical protein
MLQLDSCRSVFPEASVFLCTFHVFQAWLKQLRVKMRNKARIKEAFQVLHAVACLHSRGSWEERVAEIDSAIGAFKAEFADEPEVLKYFETTWEGKRGMAVYMHKFWSCHGFTCLNIHAYHDQHHTSSDMHQEVPHSTVCMMWIFGCLSFEGC